MNEISIDFTIKKVFTKASIAFGQYFDRLIDEAVQKSLQRREKEFKRELFNVIDETISSVEHDMIDSGELRAAFRNRIAKVLVAEMGLSAERIINDFRTKPENRIKLENAITKALEKFNIDTDE